jgi:hypothetical protein
MWVIDEIIGGLLPGNKDFMGSQHGHDISGGQAGTRL